MPDAQGNADTHPPADPGASTPRVMLDYHPPPAPRPVLFDDVLRIVLIAIGVACLPVEYFFVVSPSNPTMLYAAGGFLIFCGVYGPALYRRRQRKSELRAKLHEARRTPRGK